VEQAVFPTLSGTPMKLFICQHDATARIQFITQEAGSKTRPLKKAHLGLELLHPKPIRSEDGRQQTILSVLSILSNRFWNWILILISGIEQDLQDRPDYFAAMLPAAEKSNRLQQSAIPI